MNLSGSETYFSTKARILNKKISQIVKIKNGFLNLGLFKNLICVWNES